MGWDGGSSAWGRGWQSHAMIVNETCCGRGSEDTIDFGHARAREIDWGFSISAFPACVKRARGPAAIADALVAGLFILKQHAQPLGRGAVRSLAATAPTLSSPPPADNFALPPALAQEVFPRPPPGAAIDPALVPIPEASCAEPAVRRRSPRKAGKCASTYPGIDPVWWTP
jgi:hypothetical protein